jgi:guanine deaminase
MVDDAAEQQVSSRAAASEHGRHLQRAVELARHGMSIGDGGPFGAVVVRRGQVLAEGWNRVLATNDPTAHAEVTAIRAACAALGSFQLTDSVVYASCEPCPMCLGALYWARPCAVYFAATRDDAAAAGFDDSFIYDEIALATDDRSLRFRRLPVDGCAEVFTDWTAKADHTPY